MIQRIVYDDDGNTILEFDEEGIEYLIDALHELLIDEVGTVLSTPTIGTNDTGELVVGEFRLSKVA